MLIYFLFLFFVSVRECDLSFPSSSCGIHGICIPRNSSNFAIVGECECEENYFGVNCSEFFCGKYEFDHIRACHGRGICVAHNMCNCSNFSYGKYCKIRICDGIFDNYTELVCNGKGGCLNNNTCECMLGFSGRFCEIDIDSFLFDESYILPVCIGIFIAVFSLFVGLCALDLFKFQQQMTVEWDFEKNELEGGINREITDTPTDSDLTTSLSGTSLVDSGFDMDDPDDSFDINDLHVLEKEFHDLSLSKYIKKNKAKLVVEDDSPNISGISDVSESSNISNSLSDGSGFPSDDDVIGEYTGDGKSDGETTSADETTTDGELTQQDVEEDTLIDAEKKYEEFTYEKHLIEEEKKKANLVVEENSPNISGITDVSGFSNISSSFSESELDSSSFLSDDDITGENTGEGKSDGETTDTQPSTDEKS